MFPRSTALTLGVTLRLHSGNCNFSQVPNCSTIRILGIDPGTATVGYGLLDYQQPSFNLSDPTPLEPSRSVPLASPPSFANFSSQIEAPLQTNPSNLVIRSPVESLSYVTSGIIKTPSHLDPGSRLAIIRQDLKCLIEEYSPQIVAIEAIFFFKNAKTLVPVAQARGVILECAASMGVTSAEYTPMQVKLTLTGFGRADKRLVQQTLARLFNHNCLLTPDDAADALAVAICHARMSLQTLQATTSQ